MEIGIRPDIATSIVPGEKCEVKFQYDGGAFGLQIFKAALRLGRSDS